MSSRYPRAIKGPKWYAEQADLDRAHRERWERERALKAQFDARASASQTQKPDAIGPPDHPRCSECGGRLVLTLGGYLHAKDCSRSDV